MKRENESDRVLLEYAARDAEERMRPHFTRFLDPAGLAEAEEVRRGRSLAFVSWGGYDGAERKIGCFCPEGEEPAESGFPVVCLRSPYNGRFASISHRDVLGAVMGLGLERDGVGDVAMCREGACVFVHRDVAGYVRDNLESAGRAALKREILDKAPELLPPEGEELRVTVNALRLDAVLAAGLRLSRAEAQRLVTAGLVKRNHIPETRGDCRLAEGDLLSARGFGRLQVRRFEGETKKGRLGVRLFRYGK